LDSILARGLAVIISIWDPDFFSRMPLVMPGVRPVMSSISGSPSTSRALSEVRRETVPAEQCLGLPLDRGEHADPEAVLEAAEEVRVYAASLGSSTISVATTSATARHLPD
jgi:hypothetical protein